MFSIRRTFMRVLMLSLELVQLKHVEEFVIWFIEVLKALLRISVTVDINDIVL